MFCSLALITAINFCIFYKENGYIFFHFTELLRLIMPGVQAHIGSSEFKIRQQGMVLAETLISVIDPNGPKLKFEVHVGTMLWYLQGQGQDCYCIEASLKFSPHQQKIC